MILLNKSNGLRGCFKQNGAIRMLQPGEARTVPLDQREQVRRRWDRISNDFVEVAAECNPPTPSELAAPKPKREKRTYQPPAGAKNVKQQQEEERAAEARAKAELEEKHRREREGQAAAEAERKAKEERAAAKRAGQE